MANYPEPSPAGVPAADWTVRGVDRDEYADVVRVVGEALLSSDDTDVNLERVRPLLDSEGYGRVLAAVDGDEVVGSANDFAFEMTMPGGPRPVAGVTGVGVWPTYRRRGVLSALMRRQLTDIHARGENVAALYASEGGIYSRFGYGPASMEMTAVISRAHAALVPDAPRDPGLDVRLRHPERARGHMARVYREDAATRIGRFQRSDVWWDRVLADSPGNRGGKGPLKAVVVSGSEGPRGYALYCTESEWGTGGPNSTVYVKELVSLTPAARVALYDHVLSRDLTSRIVLESVAVDDPVWSLLADRQRIVATPHTALWVRLVDVRAALAERTYAAPVEVVVEVTDRYAPWNAGRWRLKADRGGSRCEATDSAPDLVLDVSHIGAAYLGQHTLGSRLAAGLLTEHTPGAADLLDTALRATHAPLCGVVF